MEKDKRHFITEDLGLATLLCFVAGLDKVINGQFFFDDTEEVREMAKEYEARKTSVEPRMFLEKFYYLQKLVHSNIK